MRADKPRRESGVRDMVLTLAVIFAFIALGWPAFVHQKHASIRVVDYSRALNEARPAAGFPLQSPEGLPAGWRATSAYPVAGQAPGFHVGFVTPANQYAGVEQTDAPPAQAVRTFLQDGSTPRDTATIGGRQWELRDTAKGAHALVRSADGDTVVVTGTAGWGELQALAASLR